MVANYAVFPESQKYCVVQLLQFIQYKHSIRYDYIECLHEIAQTVHSN